MKSWIAGTEYTLNKPFFCPDNGETLTANGIDVIKRNSFVENETENFFENLSVREIFKDRENSIWIATREQGIKRLREGKFTTYTLKQGISNNLPVCLYEDSKKNLWVGLKNGEINKLNKKGSKFYRVKWSSYLGNDIIRAIYEDKIGNLWVGSFGSGLFKISNNDILQYTENEGLISNFVRTIFLDSKGDLWIGTREGISIYKNGKWFQTNKPGAWFWCVECVGPDDIWAGSDTGDIYHYAGSN